MKSDMLRIEHITAQGKREVHHLNVDHIIRISPQDDKKQGEGCLIVMVDDTRYWVDVSDEELLRMMA